MTFSVTASSVTRGGYDQPNGIVVDQTVQSELRRHVAQSLASSRPNHRASDGQSPQI